MASLGRLEPVQLREVWPNEASDFTPWLAENLDVLGQAVGLALELRQREHPVGRYALDLLLEDARGRVVIVENQLEQTDHTHLGQLLTYCAGAKADAVAAEERGLPWQPVMNKGYIAIQRPGAYNVLVVDLWYAKVPRLAAKIPGPPETLGLTSPYPSLQEVWTASGNEWGWTVPPGSAIPDVGQLIDLIRPYHPARGPMRAPQRYGPATPAS